MYFIVKNLRRQIEIPPDKFGKMIDVPSLTCAVTCVSMTL